LVHDLKKSSLSDIKKISSIDSRDAKLAYLYNQVIRNPSQKAQLNLAEEMNRRMKIDFIFAEFGKTLNIQQKYSLPINFDCLRSMMDTYETSCGKFDEYDLKYVRYFVQECENLPLANQFEAPMLRLKAICAK